MKQADELTTQSLGLLGKRRFLTALMALLVIAVRSCAPAPDVVRIGWQAVPNDESYILAERWYEKELGIRVELRQFESGRDVNTAIAAGSIDLGQLGSAPAAVGISRGLPYQIIWIHDVIGDGEGLVVKSSTKIDAVANLVGKKIAVPVGSTAHFSLLNALKFGGIEARSVTILDLQPQDIWAAWRRNDIDAAYVWEPTLGKLLADGRLLTTSKELAEKGAATADLEVVRSDFARRHPEVVAAYVKLQIKAHEAIKSRPDEVASTIAKSLSTDTDAGVRQVKGLIWLTAAEQISAKYLGTAEHKGAMTDALKATADFLVEQKIIDRAASREACESAVNPEFIEKSLK